MKKGHILGEIYKIVATNNSHLRELWIHHIVFTWRWWLGVGLTIIPWIIWIKVHNKKDTLRLLFVGLVVALITNIFDLIGICYGFWYYDYKVTPMTVIYIPWDLALFPVAIMLLLQFLPQLNKYIKAIGFAMFCAFVFEPVFSWLGIYVFVNWHHWYSFIIYIGLYLLVNKLYNSRIFYSKKEI